MLYPSELQARFSVDYHSKNLVPFARWFLAEAQQYVPAADGLRPYEDLRN